MRIDPGEIPVDDARTYELFTAGKTSGLFQFESDGMRDILKRFKPDRLEHLTALNALYRPGPMQMIDDFIKRRHGQTRVSFEHPALEPILKETYGVMVYQEQVMQIASALAGFTLGEADILRKAMGKKKAEVMATQMDQFLKGCASARRRREEGRSGSGTRWSSSRATASTSPTPPPTPGSPTRRPTSRRTSRPTSWPRCSRRSARTRTRWSTTSASAARWACACCRPTSTAPTCSSPWCRRRTESSEPGAAGFTPADDIRFGLSAIKNVGEGAVEAVLAARREGGAFSSLFDFCDRIDLRAVNRRVVESFVKSGCFDSGDPRRSALFAAIERATEAGQKRQRDREAGQSSLFGALGMAEEKKSAPERVPDAPPWPEAERLAFEKESLGFFISGHPLERFRAELEQWANATTGTLAQKAAAGEVTVGGIVTALRLLKTKKGDRMAAFFLEDMEGSVETVVFPDAYKKAAGRLADDQVVLVKARAEVDDDGKAKLLASEVLPLEQAKLAEARFVTIRVPLSAWDRGKGERLRDILGAHRGDCPVTLEIVRPGAWSAALAPSAYYRVRPDSVLRDEIEALLGPGSLVLTRTNGLAREA